MKETPLAKGLGVFDPVSAANQLYDSLTKSNSMVPKATYDFVHDMVDKINDGEKLTEVEIQRLHRVYVSKFG